MTLLTYAPDRVIVNVMGIFDITGYVSDTFVEITKEVTPYSYQSAMDGETSRTFKKDGNYQVKITLAQSSESNDFLNALHSLDVATQLGKVPLLIRDRNGTTNFFSPNAWIENYPTVTYGKDIVGREWVFKCTEGALLIGGNGEPNPLISILNAATTVSNFLGN